MNWLAVCRRRKRLPRGVPLLGEQPRRKPLAFRDSLDFQRDGVDGLIELGELRADFSRNLRRTRASPVHAARESAGKWKSHDNEGHREKEGDGDVHGLLRNYVPGAEARGKVNDGCFSV